MSVNTPDQQQAARPAAEPSAMDNLTELSALVHLLKEQYQQQVLITKQMAKAEWRLSSRSMALSGALLGGLLVGAIVLWASIIAFAGYLLFLATESIAISAGLLILLQAVLLVWCGSSIKYLMSQIGFGHTKQQLVEFFHTTPQPGDSNANSTTDPQGTPGR